MARHQLTVFDAWGRYKFAVPTWVSVKEERGENDIGLLTLVLDGKTYRYEDFPRDTIIMFERAVDGRSPFLLVGETLWQVGLPVDDLPTASTPDTITLSAYSANNLLNRRIVAFFDEEPETEKADLGDDMMRDIVRENLLGVTDYNGAAPLRSMAPWLSVGPNKSEGQWVEKKFGWLKVLQVLQEIAQTSYNLGTYLAFDIVCTQPPLPLAANPRFRLEFKTYAGQRGTDRRKGTRRPVSIGPDRGNLERVQIVNDWTQEETHLYVGGEGDGITRDIAEADAASIVGLSPFGRKEGWYDERDMDLAAELDSSARAALQGRLGRARVSGTYVDTPQLRYGREFGFGDLVTLEARGTSTNVRLSFERLTVARDSAEQIELTMTELLL